MRRALVAAVAIVLLASACSKVTYITPEAATDAAGSGRTPAIAVEPTVTPEPATAEPEPTVVDRDDRIRPGVWVRVEGAGDCLNFRAHPSADDERIAITYCRPDGFAGYVAAGPDENDDGRWWFVAGLGWAVEDHLVFDRTEDLSQRVVPELAGLGRIAFVGPDGDLWTMSSDGSDRRRVVDIDPSPEFAVSRPQLSANAHAIMYESSRDGRSSIHIADLFGNDVYVFENSTLASWSPDGGRVALLYDIQESDVGSISATPAVIDLVDGDVTPIGPLQFSTNPIWRPGGDELLYSNREGDWLASADGSPPVSIDLPGIVPSWSPDGAAVSLRAVSGDCAGYVVFHIARREPVLCALVPEPNGLPSGRGGTQEDRQTDWSPDGRYFAYHTEGAVANRSGVYVVDARNGEQTLLPGWKPAFTSFAPDSRHVVFSTSAAGGEFIWVGDIETGEVVLLAEGSQPALVAPR